MKRLSVAPIPAIVIAIALGLGAPTGSHMARAHEPGEYDPNAFVQHAPCHEVIPDLIEVGYDDADGMIPNGYTPVRDDEGTAEDPRDDTAEIQLVTGHCQKATVAGVPIQDVIVSYWHIRIVPYDSPLCGSDGVECPKRPPHDSYLRLVPQVETPVESELREERYLFQWVTNKKEVAQWLKRGTGLGEDVVRYVPDLEFRYNPQPVDAATGHPVRGAIDNNFFFGAPPPAVAPFHIGCDPDDPSGCAAPCATEPGGCAECQLGPAPGCGEVACDYAKTECARVAEPFAGEFDPGENYWRDTEAGTVIIFGEHPVGGSRIAAAGGTITSDDSNSPLGRLFDKRQTRGTASGNAAEDQAVIEWLSAEFTDDVQWTICVRHAPGECTPEEHADPCAEPLDVSDPTCDFPTEPLPLLLGATAAGAAIASGRAPVLTRRSTRRPLVAVTALAFGLALGQGLRAAPGPALAGEEGDAFINGCREVIGFFVVPVERVAPYVPDHYRLLPAAPDTTTVVVRSFHCNYTTIGVANVGAARGAQLIAEVVSPDGTGTVNWYVLFWVGDNPEFNKYLEQGTPAFPAYDVPGLTCSFTGASGVAEPIDCAGSTGGGVYTFSAPAPAPSPFAMTAVVTDSLAPIEGLEANYWHSLPQGEMKLTGSPPEGGVFHLGPSEIVVTAQGGSLMAEVLGATTRTADVGVSALISGPYTKSVLKTTHYTEESSEQ